MSTKEENARRKEPKRITPFRVFLVRVGKSVVSREILRLSYGNTRERSALPVDDAIKAAMVTERVD